MTVPEPRKLSSGNYFIQLRLGGESVPVTASTAKKCRDTAMLIKAEHKAGKRAIAQNVGNITLRQAIDDYIECRSNALSPSTIRGYRSIQNNRFRSVIDKPIKNINNWQKICNNEAKLCSAKTLKNAYRFVTSVLLENGIRAPKITLPQLIPNERPWLDPVQIPKFIEAVKGQKCEIPALLALHSLRRSEIFALTWDKIDIKSKLIYVDGAAVFNDKQKLVQKPQNKNASSKRTVPIIIPELYQALLREEDKTGYIVNCHPTTLWRRINRICEQNNLPFVGIHGLRHSFASLAYHLGISEKEVMEIGGWANHETMHKIYTHIAQADKQNAVSKMAKYYINANENANGVQKV